MSMIALSIVMAITVEGLVELGKSIGKAALDGDRKTAATQLAALIISCALCMAAGRMFTMHWAYRLLSHGLA